MCTIFFYPNFQNLIFISSYIETIFKSTISDVSERTATKIIMFKQNLIISWIIDFNTS